MCEYVEETQNGLKFPSSIPNKRGKGEALATTMVSFILIIIGSIITHLDLCLYMCWFPILTTFLFIVEIIGRFCSLFEEVKHLKSRYNSSFIKLLQNVFSFSSISIGVLIMSVLIILVVSFVFHKNLLSIKYEENGVSLLLLAASVFLIKKYFKMDHSPLNQSLLIDKLNGIDYGSGMAHSFFYGYLRIVLPNSGRQTDKGIKEFLQDYEGKNNVTFERVYKLLILIPLSQHCPPSLANEFSPSVEESRELESKEMDRAGVKKRNYKNSVYKIKTKNGLKRYVSAEYATPIKTLMEVINQNTPHGNIFMKHRKEILLNFYTTLRDLLKNDPECCNLCEVIFYNDKDIKTGAYHDVGLIILNRLKKLIKKKS